MFDGNHRSRRQINLASNTRRNRNSALSTKAALLERTRIQREERQAEQRRQNGARLIQKVWRGNVVSNNIVLHLRNLQGDDVVLIRSLSFMLSKPLRRFLTVGMNMSEESAISLALFRLIYWRGFMTTPSLSSRLLTTMLVLSSDPRNPQILYTFSVMSTV